MKRIASPIVAGVIIILSCRSIGALPDAADTPSGIDPNVAEIETIPISPIVSLPTSQAPSPILSETTISEPVGCLRPPDDYTRLELNGYVISARTLAMLEHAYSLYGGPIDIRGPAITQGHYTDLEPLSFGTHSGGGVVDLSVIDRSEWRVMYEEVEPLIAALRTAGFAAWLRVYGELSPDSPIHIHAVAVGDAELSLAAQQQLTGKFGYFRGFNGLPQDSGWPVEDMHGGPVLCAWMVELGYADQRDE